jgi:FlaG/FlaF family flagellin (archaellin)
MVAITVVLAGVLYVWASSLAEGNTDGNLALYAFSGKDAQGATGTGTDDNLIMLTMDQGGDINWASISVKLSVDGAAPVTCDNPGVEGTAVCSLVEFGDTDDQVWSVGDGVTVVENNADVCGNADGCTIDVTITDTREGKTIDTTNGVPAE